ncbi:MAG: MgtC/SapB family protein [Tepidiformaceae bacterium]
MSTPDLIGRLVIAILLSGAIGLEREFRRKHAGLRTHALVGLGAALIIEVSSHGFSDVLVTGQVVLDPSRVAAQVVSGIGFIGAGLIFVRRDDVRGLTTAASVWLTAAIGLAAGAGMWEVGVVATVLGLAVVEGLELLEARIRHNDGPPVILSVTYHDEDDAAFHRIVAACEQQEAASVGNVRLQRKTEDPHIVNARIEVRRLKHGVRLAHELLGLDGVVEVALDTT